MDIALLIRERLSELGLEQRELAVAARVTESYISQLLTRKKSPPAPARTDLYEKIGAFLHLSVGELERLAELQRHHDLLRTIEPTPAPLFSDCRQLILRKCAPALRPEVQRLFEKEPFGELERLVTQLLLDITQGLAREELKNDQWLLTLAGASGRSFEQMRVAVLEFLDSDVSQISLEACASFLDPMIEAWDLDLKSFRVNIALNPRLAPARRRSFAFQEVDPQPELCLDPGLDRFLHDPLLSADATPEEIAFLRALPLQGRRPTPLYFYRALQILRDPLHFQPAAPPAESNRRRHEP